MLWFLCSWQNKNETKNELGALNKRFNWKHFLVYCVRKPLSWYEWHFSIECLRSNVKAIRSGCKRYHLRCRPCHQSPNSEWTDACVTVLPEIQNKATKTLAIIITNSSNATKRQLQWYPTRRRCQVEENFLYFSNSGRKLWRLSFCLFIRYFCGISSASNRWRLGVVDINPFFTRFLTTDPK